MGLWKKTDTPDSSTVAPDKGTQVRNMVGYEDLASAAAVAPASTARPTSTDETSSKSRRATKTAQQPTAPGPSAAEIAKERLRLEAMQAVGESMMKEIAGLPYEVWAFWVGNSELKLNKEETEKLAKQYYLLAQALNPDFSSPIMICISIGLTNAAMVGKRWKVINDEKMRDAALESNAELIPDRKPS